MSKLAKVLLVIGTVWMGALGCEQSSAPDPARPNVVLVTIDTLRADHVGVYGASVAQTPVLDSLAAQGVRFGTAYSTAPTTLPSHTSIMTGLYPTHHGVRHNGIFQVEARVETLAEQMQAAGYQTAAVVGAFVLNARFGLNQGFEFYNDEMSRVAGLDGYEERPANEVTDRALAWLKTKHKKPFFLWVHYYDPHAAYQPPAPYAERFAKHLYAGEVAFVDAQLGRLVEALREQKQMDHTLIVVTSDHGESLGEHGEETHSYTLYDATLAVPLIVCGPNIPAGKVVAPVVSTAGIAPMVLSILGKDTHGRFDGLDLSRFWKENIVQEPPAAYAETLSTQFVHGWAPLFALRSQTHLYVRAPRAELYDVQTDPQQTANQLQSKTNAEALRLAGEFDVELETLSSVQSAIAPKTDVDVETLQQLEKLGYAMPVVAAQVQRQGLDPKDGLHWLIVLHQARVLLHQGDVNKANELTIEVLEAMPDSADALAFKAQIDLKARRLDDALRYAERAMQLSPHSVVLKVLTGFICKELGDETRAVQVFREVEKAGTADSANAEAGILWTYAREGKIAEAELHEKKARGYVPTETALLEIGKAWEQVGEYERALKAYQLVLEDFPASEETNMLLAIQMARFGDEKKAANYLSRAGKEARNPVHQNRLGIVYAARGDFKKAEQIFVDILSRNPEYALAQRNLEIIRSKMQ